MHPKCLTKPGFKPMTSRSWTVLFMSLKCCRFNYSPSVTLTESHYITVCGCYFCLWGRNAFSHGVDHILDSSTHRIHLLYLYISIFQINVLCIVSKHVCAVTEIEGKFTNETLQWSFTVAYLAPFLYERNPYALNAHFSKLNKARGKGVDRDDTFSLYVSWFSWCSVYVSISTSVSFHLRHEFKLPACLALGSIPRYTVYEAIMFTPAACYSTCKQCCFITSNSCSFTCLRHWCKQYLVGLHVSKSAKVQLLGVKSPALSTIISYKSTAPPAISVP